MKNIRPYKKILISSIKYSCFFKKLFTYFEENVHVIKKSVHTFKKVFMKLKLS